MPEPETLGRDFFARPTIEVARDLLGKVLVHRGTAGIIVETEAYPGGDDLASHSARGITDRTRVIFGPPGHAYVYLIYGMHHCFNVVCGKGSAVLIRAVEPLSGVEGRTDGPGRLTRALGLAADHYGLSLQGPTLLLEEGPPVPSRQVRRGPRIGVAYAGAWATKPFRLWEAGNPHVSRPR